MKSRIEVDAGICGFHTTVLALSPDNQDVSFEIVSDCAKIRVLADVLKAGKPVDAYTEMDSSRKSVLIDTLQKGLKGCCAGCVVPSAIFKGMQVSAGLALPEDVCLKITQE